MVKLFGNDVRTMFTTMLRESISNGMLNFVSLDFLNLNTQDIDRGRKWNLVFHFIQKRCGYHRNNKN